MSQKPAKPRPPRIKITGRTIEGDSPTVLRIYLIRSITLLLLVWLIAHYGLPAAIVGALGKLLEHISG